MSRSIYQVVVMIVTAIIFSACFSNATIDSSDANEDKFYGTYEATYDADTYALRFFVQFQVGGAGGTTVRLTPPSEVSVDGQRLQLHDGDSSAINIIGTYYTLGASTQLPPSSHSFLWKRTDGASYVNRITVAAPIVVVAPSNDSAHAMRSDLHVELSGNQLSGGESFHLSVCSNENTGSGQSGCVFGSISSGMSYVFPGSELARLPAGSAKIVAERSRRESVQQGHEAKGGVLRSSYRAKPVVILIQ